jgi:hypothetical protein
MSEEIREAFIPGLATVRSCIDCGVLISGGPTRCIPCAFENEPSRWARIKYRVRWLLGKRAPWAGAIFAALTLATSVQAGAGIHAVFKGSPASADVPALVASRDFIVFGDGTGPSKIRAARTANPTVPLAVYVKAGGARVSDAEWNDAQPLLWRQASGEPFLQSQNGWAFGDLQRFPNQWAATVVIPHLRAALAGLEPGVVTWIFVDNVIFQDPSLFSPAVPREYDAKAYHDGTLAVLRAIRAAFPDQRIIVNGWQGGAPAGFRGEVLGGNDPATGLPWADGVWFECWYRRCNGKPPTAERFAQDQGALLAFMQAGKVTVVDEAGLQPYSAAWREAFGVWLATTGRVGRWESAYFNVSAGPFEGWIR